MYAHPLLPPTCRCPSSTPLQEATLTARAVRNLPWSAELWCRRLRSLERSPERSLESGAEELAGVSAAVALREVWREALASALPSPDDYIKVNFFSRKVY